MDGIEVAEGQVTTMEEIAHGVRGLRIAFVNVFGVMHEDGTWTLIDAGVPGSAGRIQGWAELEFGKPPRSLVLTHGHFDHVGGAKDLAERWKIEVWAHAEEWPYLTGQEEYAAPDWKAGGGLMSLLSPLYPAGPVDLRASLREMPRKEGEEFAELPGWRVLHTPGHTPGHVSFLRESDGTLLVGDAFCTTKPESFFEAAIAQHPELHGPPAYFTSDWAAAQRSVERLAGLRPQTVAPGHGKPLKGEGVADRLGELAARFREVAVPEDVKKGS